MLILRIQKQIFKGKPANYRRIDKYMSRSAQPKEEDLVWIKKHGVTDIINFRTMVTPSIDYNEKEVVQKLGMKYHNIPTVTANPNVNNVNLFLNLVDSIIKSNGKIHIHCKAGADRTGMYAFIYKSIKQLGSSTENLKEWLFLGHNRTRYPNLIEWAETFIKNYKK